MTDKETCADISFEAELEEVWALFAEDGRESLDTVEEALLTLESDPADAEHIVRLFRALHTFKGNARMMGLDVIESLAHHAEDLVALVRDQGVVLTGEMVDLLLEILDQSRTMLDHIVAQRHDVEAARVEGLVAKLHDMLAKYPRGAPSSQEVSSKDVEKVAPIDGDAVTASELEDDDFFPGDVLGLVPAEEFVDPATDPEYVRIFLEIAEDGMERLRAALDMLARDEEQDEGLEEIRDVVDSLGRAARRMGYEHLVPIVDELEVAVEEWDGAAQIGEFERLEARLSEELAAIEDAIPSTSPLTGLRPDSGQTQPAEPESAPPSSLGSRRDRLVEQLRVAVSTALTTEQSVADEDAYQGIFDVESSQRLSQSSSLSLDLCKLGDDSVALDDLPDTSRLFRSWCNARMQADLARLGKVVDELEQFMRQFLADGSVLAWDKDLVDEVSYLLRAIYYSCVFHRLDHGARTTLGLEDLYARVAVGEMTISGTLLDLTRTYVTQLKVLVEAVCAGKMPNTTISVDLLGQIEEVLHLYAESRVRQGTKDVLDLLEISSEFKDVMTAENLLEVSRALQGGKSFYTVLADLNQYEEIGQAFYEWSRSNGVRLITNITVFQDKRTLFRFLLATNESQEAIWETFAEMDPQGEYLSLEKCALREGVDIQEAVSAMPVQPTFCPEPRSVDTQSAVSGDALAGFLASVGEMVATRATLHRVTQRLTEVKLLEAVDRLMEQSDGDWYQVRKELQAALESWTDDLDTLSHAENELGAALDRFQEVALALRARPAAEILDPLQRLVEDVARHLGKVVDLDVIGADVGLDHSSLDVLADPVRRLVWFAVAHGIEKPVDRREVGKPANGRISVTVARTADRVQVVIEDDGNGLDPAAILKRARELGWTKGHKIPKGGLSEWVLRDGFGAVGNSYDVEGLDLAAINTGLQPHRGRLDVTSQPRQGTRFSIDLPLDMVVIDGMVMRVGDVRYVVPIEAVRRIVSPEKTQIVRSSADGGRDMLRLEDELVPVQALRQSPGRVLSWNEEVSRDTLLLVVEHGGQDWALVVDELIGQQQVLIQPLQGRLADVQSISGCALLGEGDVGLVLDLYQMRAQI